MWLVSSSACACDMPLRSSRFTCGAARQRGCGGAPALASTATCQLMRVHGRRRAEDVRRGAASRCSARADAKAQEAQLRAACFVAAMRRVHCSSAGGVGAQQPQRCERAHAAHGGERAASAVRSKQAAAASECVRRQRTEGGDV
jgi:hypothetical protein